jgi:hypothetical protein
MTKACTLSDTNFGEPEWQALMENTRQPAPSGNGEREQWLIEALEAWSTWYEDYKYAAEVPRSPYQQAVAALSLLRSQPAAPVSHGAGTVCSECGGSKFVPSKADDLRGYFLPCSNPIHGHGAKQDEGEL